MTISQSKALFKKLKVDERFRNRLLAAESMAERMEIVSAQGFDCSKDEIKTVIELVAEQKRVDNYAHFTLWGNRVNG
jgi:predicted ribosomally synthesized peptide with nif11-like leader